MNLEPVCIATFPNQTLASLASATLEARGINSYVACDDCGGMRPYMQPIQGVRLFVHPDDAQAALEILQSAN